MYVLSSCGWGWRGGWCVVNLRWVGGNDAIAIVSTISHLSKLIKLVHELLNHVVNRLQRRKPSPVQEVNEGLHSLVESLPLNVDLINHPMPSASRVHVVVVRRARGLETFAVGGVLGGGIGRLVGSGDRGGYEERVGGSGLLLHEGYGTILDDVNEVVSGIVVTMCFLGGGMGELLSVVCFAVCCHLSPSP